MTRIALVLGLLTALVLSGNALACSCAIGDPRDRLADVDAAFVGVLLDRVVDGDQAIHTFRVEDAVKGELGETVQVRSHRDGATCGLEVPVGERPPVIDAYRELAGRTVAAYWKKLPDPADHPVFRLEPIA